MINYIIIDDEQHSIDVINHYASQIPNLNLVLATTNPVDALFLINEGNVDLAFCDIQMPYVSGLEIAKNAIGKCKIIFITAYSEHALDGYEFGIVDYLLKPFQFSRFLIAVQKAIDILGMQKSSKKQSSEFYEEAGLTRREVQIVSQIVKNKTAKEIADSLFIAKSTVNKHISNIYKKANVKGKYEILNKIDSRSI